MTTTQDWLKAARSDRRLTAASREMITALVRYAETDGRLEPDAIALADELGIAESTVYARLKRVVERGYLIYVPSSDPRAHAYQIATPNGRAALEERIARLEATLAEVVGRLDALEQGAAGASEN